jgi:lysozyme
MKVPLPANVSPRHAGIVALAVALAAPMEGLRQYAYYDPPGVLTVCYGHTGSVQKGRLYSKAECEGLLGQDMLDAVRTVDRCVPGLPWKTAAAWADAVFNLGPTIACDQKRSTAARLLRAGMWREACMQLPRWNKARVAGKMVELPGLTKRRHLEKDLCLEGLT